MNCLKASFRSLEVVKNERISENGCPYIEFGAKAYTRKKILLTEGS